MSERERAALDAERGGEVHWSARTVKRGRADLRRRYGAATFTEAVRRHQVSVDEGTARLDRLERMLGDAVSKIDKLGSNGSSREVERQVSRIEDEFTAEELQQVRDHRDYEKFRRYADRYAEELERDALAAGATTNDTDGEDDDEDEAAEDDDSKPAAKKPAAKPAKRKPPSRHPAPDPDDEQQSDGLLARLMKD